MDKEENRWKRRDQKWNKKRKMKVDGAGNKELARIIRDKAREIKRKQENNA